MIKEAKKAHELSLAGWDQGKEAVNFCPQVPVQGQEKGRNPSSGTKESGSLLLCPLLYSHPQGTERCPVHWREQSALQSPRPYC